MNGNWAKILLFSLIFGILGFILGRMCGSCGTDNCGPGGMRGEACMHEGMRGDRGMHGNKGRCCNMKGDRAMGRQGMDDDQMEAHDMMDSAAVAQ